ASTTLCMVSGGVDGQVCRWSWNPDSSGAGSTSAPRDHNGERASKSERRWWPGLSPTTDSPPPRVWNTRAATRGASTTIQRFTVDLSTAVTSVAATEGPDGNSVVAYSTDTGVVGLAGPFTQMGSAMSQALDVCSHPQVIAPPDVNSGGKVFLGLREVECGEELFADRKGPEERGALEPQVEVTRMKHANGSWYEGQVCNGIAHGWGRLQYPNGASYEGQWVGGMANGRGTYKCKGSRYRGSWMNDLKHGDGEEKWADGCRYAGQ
ncbi:hypothetical protein FOZ63_005663, partial [Perkinsus olseni]